MGYIKNVLVGLDQAANTILGGHPDETISARSGRMAKEGKLWAKIVAGALNTIAKDHTTHAEIHDDARAEVVETLEESALDKLKGPFKK